MKKKVCQQNLVAFGKVSFKILLCLFMLFHSPVYFHGLPTWHHILNTKYHKIMETFSSIIKPGARSRRPRAPGFLKLLWFARRYVCVCVCVCVCPPPRPLITSGMIWCDIDRVRLVKQVLRLFPAFNYFIQQLPSIKWMGVAILKQLVVNACQRKLR